MSGRIVEPGGSGDRSTILRDEETEPVELPTGRHLHRLWETDRLSCPDAGGSVAQPPYPAPNGARYWLLTIPAGDADLPFHATPTVDLGLVLAGRVRLEMRDGSAATLETGDTFVQRATSHRWHNAGRGDAVIAVAVLGAHHHGTPEVAP